ncbi:hypothetical protein IWZ03DRAFT_217985 [Phyllosticta citriasiana]|uniref:N-acetyltransferase domain-containing protein n=1 Tax=Phyllosticta citriasiana TaxID=595635 RepID=A0ABR1KLI5_9PEZI
MVARHVVPINTLKNSIHALNHPDHSQAPHPASQPLSFGEHRRISSIPGSKTAAAFLTSLSANLTLPDSESPLPSPMSTPSPLRGSNHDLHGSHLPPPSPLSSAVTMAPDETNESVPPDSLSPAHASKPIAARGQPPSSPIAPAEARLSTAVDGSEDPLAGVPELVTTTATTEDDKIAALKLVADSVAQQRQAASWALLSHPTMLAAYVGLLAVVSHFVWRTDGDWPRLLTTGAGVTMALLVAVRLITGRYISLAEQINWSFLDDADSLIVTKFGERMIGVLVLGWAGPNMQGNRAQRRRKGKGVVKAWTVLLKYRGTGVGLGLLEEAVRETVRRGGEGVEFADDHANSHRILPAYFNGTFERGEKRARKALQSVIETSGAFGGRRRKSSLTKAP